MDEAIPFARPLIGAEEEAAVLRVLRSGWLTTGAEALAFEREFAGFFSAGSGEAGASLVALAVNSATSGLHLALEALGIGPGDAVLVPSFTFTSTAEVVRYLGADPVFVDIAPDSFNMDPAALERTLRGPLKSRDLGTLTPKAVIPVHYGGLPCDMEAITAIARRQGLFVVEDAAHAFPAQGPGAETWAGTWGDAGVFSFYATKTITTGEGGMVLTADSKLAERVAVMRSHGIDRAAWNRYTDPKSSWYYEVIAPGFKYNLPDLLAAVGRVQLSRAMDMLDMRRRIAVRYDEAFASEEALAIPPSSPGDARHLYPLRLRDAKKRDDFISRLRAWGIGTSVHFIPLHIMPYYRDRYDLKAEDLPESYKRFTQTVSLPLWPGMKDGQIERVIASVLRAVREHW
jgi:dTDP-4-amino-4,6-dideoxygalactose transaminase